MSHKEEVRELGGKDYLHPQRLEAELNCLLL